MRDAVTLGDAGGGGGAGLQRRPGMGKDGVGQGG